MKSKFTLLAVAVAAIFTSCSKEANFTNSGTSFGGYHKAENTVAAQTATEENNVTASAETQPALASNTVAFNAPKTAKVVTEQTATTEAAVTAAAASMSKKDVKAVAKQIKKEVKKTKEGKAEGKSQIIALILVALIWPLSIHRFYLGYTGIAIAQIFTLGGCGVWALIDLIRIITGDLKPKDGEYAETL